MYENNKSAGALVSSGMAEKELTGKSGFDFTGRSVLTEELGAGAGCRYLYFVIHNLLPFIISW
jgi:hypothetical protein